MSGKSWVFHRDRLARRSPLPTVGGVLAHQLLLLGVHADYWPSLGQIQLAQLAEVAELSVPLGVLKTCLLLAARLERERACRGDSDSTGSITGNLLGAAAGVEAIPDRWLAQLELRSTIEALADDLAAFPEWRLRNQAEAEERAFYASRYPIG